MVGKGNKRGRPVENKITAAQQAALNEISVYIQQHGHAPTMSELGEQLGITSTSAHNLTKQLERKGYVRSEPRVARSLRVIKQHSISDEETHDWIPIVGVIAAGPALLAEENWLGRIRIDKKLNRTGTFFALRVSGDSMIDAGIRENDIVIVQQDNWADVGDIVVALIDGDATLKRFSRSKDGIELHAANRNYSPIVVRRESDFQVLGKVVGFSS